MILILNNASDLIYILRIYVICVLKMHDIIIKSSTKLHLSDIFQQYRVITSQIEYV